LFFLHGGLFPFRWSSWAEPGNLVFFVFSVKKFLSESSAVSSASGAHCVCTAWCMHGFSIRVTRLGKFLPTGQLFTLSSFLKITAVGQMLGLLLSKKVMYKLWLKIGWATFWADLSQTRLVTLVFIHAMLCAWRYRKSRDTQKPT
jgi:hypothetical protein